MQCAFKSPAGGLFLIPLFSSPLSPFPLFLSSLILSTLLLTRLSAGTCYTITGIGTSLADDFPIDTHVDRVTCDDPVATEFHGMPVCEMRGTVSGIGWGGGGIVARAVNAHYRYEIPFLARWRRDCPAPRLVFYNHGGGASVMAALKRDKLVGAANSNRTAENNGDELVAVGALLDQACYISINRRGLRKNGAFSATYVPPVGPLTAAEVATLEADLAAAPGDPNYRHPGIAAGAAVPLVPTNDAPTFRDVARALELVMARYAGGPFRTRIAVGTSSGARLLAALNFGRSVIGMAGARTGGNHVVPYDGNSARIYDGFILSGFTYAPNVPQADSALPLSAPVMFYQGLGDERYQQHVTMAHELMQRGVTLNGRVWLYEIKNQTHITRDIVAETTQPSDGDRLGCFVSAGIRNLRRQLEEGAAPPRSRMDGRIISGALQFDQANGTTTTIAPASDDGVLDKIIEDVNLVKRTIGPAETARWQAVTAALPHEPESLAPPTVACRIGGYRLMFFGSQRDSFTPAELAAKYGTFANFKACVTQAVAKLEATGLYDSRVESATETAELARGLFP